MLSGYECMLLSQRTEVQFPAPLPGGLQPLEMPAPDSESLL